MNEEIEQPVVEEIEEEIEGMEIDSPAQPQVATREDIQAIADRQAAFEERQAAIDAKLDQIAASQTRGEEVENPFEGKTLVDLLDMPADKFQQLMQGKPQDVQATINQAFEVASARQEILSGFDAEVARLGLPEDMASKAKQNLISALSVARPEEILASYKTQGYKTPVRVLHSEAVEAGRMNAPRKPHVETGSSGATAQKSKVQATAAELEAARIFGTDVTNFVSSDRSK